MITNTPPGGQNLAQNGVFTPRFRLHTGVTRLLDVFFDRASVFFDLLIEIYPLIPLPH